MVQDKDIILPKIFIVCSIHGYEKAASFVTYEFLKQVFSNWESNEFLEYIRYGVEFVIVPVANPAGWNANSGAGTRQNFNGVDLNRNFPVNFSPTQTNAGDSALSEVESSALYDFMEQEINSQTILAFDFHNFHGVEETNPENHNLTWSISIRSSLGIYTADRFTKEISAKFKAKSPLIPQREGYYVGMVDNALGEGYACSSMKRFGCVHAGLFEVSQNFRYNPNFKGFDTDAMTLGVESLGNYLRIFLKTFIEEYNNIKN